MTKQDEHEVEEIKAPEDIRGAISAALNEGGTADARSAEPDDQAQSDSGSAPAWKYRYDPPWRSGNTGGRRSAAERAIPAPGEWRASHKELFTFLPEAAQRFLTEYHQSMEADYNRKI